MKYSLFFLASLILATTVNSKESGYNYLRLGHCLTSGNVMQHINYKTHFELPDFFKDYVLPLQTNGVVQAFRAEGHDPVFYTVHNSVLYSFEIGSLDSLTFRVLDTLATNVDQLMLVCDWNNNEIPEVLYTANEGTLVILEGELNPRELDVRQRILDVLLYRQHDVAEPQLLLATTKNTQVVSELDSNLSTEVLLEGRTTHIVSGHIDSGALLDILLLRPDHLESFLLLDSLKTESQLTIGRFKYPTGAILKFDDNDTPKIYVCDHDLGAAFAFALEGEGADKRIVVTRGMLDTRHDYLTPLTFKLGRDSIERPFSLNVSKEGDVRIYRHGDNYDRNWDDSFEPHLFPSVAIDLDSAGKMCLVGADRYGYVKVLRSIFQPAYYINPFWPKRHGGVVNHFYVDVHDPYDYGNYDLAFFGEMVGYEFAPLSATTDEGRIIIGEYKMDDSIQYEQPYTFKLINDKFLPAGYFRWRMMFDQPYTDDKFFYHLESRLPKDTLLSIENRYPIFDPVVVVTNEEGTFQYNSGGYFLNPDSEYYQISSVQAKKIQFESWTYPKKSLLLSKDNQLSFDSKILYENIRDFERVGKQDTTNLTYYMLDESDSLWLCVNDTRLFVSEASMIIGKAYHNRDTLESLYFISKNTEHIFKVVAVKAFDSTLLFRDQLIYSVQIALNTVPKPGTVLEEEINISYYSRRNARFVSYQNQQVRVLAHDLFPEEARVWIKDVEDDGRDEYFLLYPDGNIKIMERSVRTEYLNTIQEIDGLQIVDIHIGNYNGDGYMDMILISSDGTQHFYSTTPTPVSVTNSQETSGIKVFQTGNNIVVQAGLNESIDNVKVFDPLGREARVKVSQHMQSLYSLSLPDIERSVVFVVVDYTDASNTHRTETTKLFHH